MIARRLWSPLPADLPAYLIGSALPDLIGQAAPRVRLRQRPPRPNSGEPEQGEEGPNANSLAPRPVMVAGTGEAVSAGVRAHLATDAAFHKTAAFAEAQVEIGTLLASAGFQGIRVRRFFVAHVLAELALDAALLRADPALGEQFYAMFAQADFNAVTRWAEHETGRPLPRLPDVLARFAASRYLLSYITDEGVATGLSRTCLRARQDSLEDDNFARLVPVVHAAVGLVTARAEALLSETLVGTGTDLPVASQKTRAGISTPYGESRLL